MADEITSEIFNHLVDLAALALTPEEGEYLRGQLNNQLRAIDELTAIPLPDDLPPAAHGVTYTLLNSQGLRPDTWQPYPDSIDIIGQVPEVDEGYVIVPDIPHTTLE
jgi:aspartyl-tRNA(Asn)/glutamyl-tRNA(Gln) amidotransferase subunit C